VFCTILITMYGAFLIILKVLSDALTAGSGVFGLLSEFKDQTTHRVTKAGKAALAGIVVGFVVSSAISFLEHEKSLEEDRQHEAEVERLLHPVGHMTAEVFVPVPRELEEEYPYIRNIKSRFRSAAKNPNEKHGNDFDGVNLSRNGGRLLEVLGLQDHMWEKFGQAPKAVFSGTTPPLDIFKGIDCNTLAKVSGQRRPDWNLWSYPHNEDPNSDDGIGWIYKPDGSLSLQRFVDAKIQQSTGAITSVEDLPGSSLFIEWDSQYPFDSLTFSPSDGVSFYANQGNTQDMTIPMIIGQIPIGNRKGYCFDFPKASSGG